jgi:3-isopropylmalate/(R)-2-methylmalate dehydratase small subunit
MESVRGNVFCYGDNVDTDVIIPARYLNTPDAAELVKHTIEDIDPPFVKEVKPGDMIVAGWNFGCGSRTADIMQEGKILVGTRAMGEAILKEI